jgi:hypothetical protein
MTDDSQTGRSGPHVFTYRGVLPPALALLVAAPLLFLVLSMAAIALAGGTLAALFVPIFLRGRWLRSQRTNAPPEVDCIELERNQYSRVDADRRRLPPA